MTSTETVQGTPPAVYEWGVQAHGCPPDWTDSFYDQESGSNATAPYTEETARQAIRSQGGYLVQLVRRLPGADDWEVVPYEPAQLSPITADMLDTREYGGLPLTVLGADDEYDYIVALGHQRPEAMAQAATLCLRDPQGWLSRPDAGVDPGAVQHAHAIRTEYWSNDDDGWCARWGSDETGPIPPGAPGSVPITIVDIR